MLKLSKHLYMSTLTSLTKNDMLKIDVAPGNYKLIPFEEGYVFSNTSEDLKKQEIVKIFAYRDGDKGLIGTYYGGESDDPNQLRLFTTWLYKHLDRSDKTYEESFVFYRKEQRIEILKRALFKYDAYEARSFDFDEYNNINFSAAVELDGDLKYVKSFKSYNNLPFLFYLSREITNFNNILLEEAGHIDICGYLWKVYEGEDHIGFVVQKKLHNMMGDQAGIGIFKGAVAFGNFDINNYWTTGMDHALQEGRYGYHCRFYCCECDTQYAYTIQKTKFLLLRLAKFKSNMRSFYSFLKVTLLILDQVQDD